MTHYHPYDEREPLSPQKIHYGEGEKSSDDPLGDGHSRPHRPSPQMVSIPMDDFEPHYANERSMHARVDPQDSYVPQPTYPPDRHETLGTDPEHHGPEEDTADDDVSVASTASVAPSFDWDEADDPDARNEGDDSDEVEKARKYLKWFMRLARPIRYLLVAVVGSSIAAIPMIIGATTQKGSPVHDHLVLWSGWASFLWLMTCASCLLIDLFPFALVNFLIWFNGTCPEIVKTRLEYFIATRLYFKILIASSWSWGTFGVFVNNIYGDGDDTRLSYLQTVIQINRSIWGSSIVLLAEKLVVQAIAINFHRLAVADRLEENKKALWTLDKLSQAKKSLAFKSITMRSARQRIKSAMSSLPTSRAQSRENSPERAPAGAGENAGRPAISFEPTERPGLQNRGSFGTSGAPHNADGRHHHHHLHHHSHHGHGHSHGHHFRHSPGSSSGQNTPGKQSPRANRRMTAQAITEQVNKALTQVTMSEGKLHRAMDNVNSSFNAKRMAKRIFYNLVGEDTHRQEVVLDDLVPFFRTKDDAVEAFRLFDRDVNGDISKLELRSAVLRIYRERRMLARTLKDNSSAVGKLDVTFMVIALVICIFIFLFVLDQNATVANLLPLSSVIVAFSFIFGNSAKTLFESLVFIFVTHPYDVGDLIFIDDQPMFVRAFGLMSTTLHHVDGRYIVAPNEILNQKLIHNVRRSVTLWEVISIQIDFYTPLSKIQTLKEMLKTWLEEDREFTGGMDLQIGEMDNTNVMVLNIPIEHKTNWQVWGARWARRTRFMKYLIKAMVQLDIRYSDAIQPVHYMPMPVGQEGGGGGGGAGPGGQPPFVPPRHSRPSRHDRSSPTKANPTFTSSESNPSQLSPRVSHLDTLSPQTFARRA